jgi:hypothetical protein
MPKAAAAPGCPLQAADRLEDSPADRGQHKLGDAVTPADGERLLTEVDQADFDFATIIGINSAWGIDNRDAMSDRQTRPRPDLQLKAFWQSCGQTGWNKRDITRLENTFIPQSGGNIHACRLSRGVFREGKITFRRRQEPAELDSNHLHHMPRPNFLTISA